MSLQEHGSAMRGAFVMVIYFMYSALGHKCCTLNMILYLIPKVTNLLAAFFSLLFLITISGLHIKLNVAYIREYKKQC